MIPYKEFQPTAFDPKGLGLREQQDWLVLPVCQTRDSEALPKSNFRVALRWLSETDSDEKESDYEQHSFNHWGPGWFDIIIVKPGTKANDIAEEIEASLEEYPILDEMDWSELELEEQDNDD